jgi:hypothetical protein
LPRSLVPIPPGVAIVEPRTGSISIFFRLAWQLLVDSFQITPTVDALDKTNQSAALVTTTLHLSTSGGRHDVHYSIVRTVNDGVSSSAQVTIGWVQNGVAKTFVATALTEASGLSYQGQAVPIFVDVNSAITIAVGYASNTPNAMHYECHADVEQKA